MLGLEENEQERAFKFYRILQALNIGMILLTLFIGGVVLYEAPIQQYAVKFFVLFIGVFMFCALMGYSSYNLQISLKNICFHLTLVIMFLVFQILIFILCIIKSTNMFEILQIQRFITEHFISAFFTFGALLILTVSSSYYR